jgi:hypothetical protein
MATKIVDAKSPRCEPSTPTPLHRAIATGIVNLEQPNYRELRENYPWLLKSHTPACQCSWMQGESLMSTMFHLFDQHVNGKLQPRWSEKRFLEWLGELPVAALERSVTPINSRRSLRPAVSSGREHTRARPRRSTPARQAHRAPVVR